MVCSVKFYGRLMRFSFFTPLGLYIDEATFGEKSSILNYARDFYFSASNSWLMTIKEYSRSNKAR